MPDYEGSEFESHVRDIHAQSYMYCTYIHTYIHTYICTYVHAQSYMYAYIHTYILYLLFGGYAHIS